MTYRYIVILGDSAEQHRPAPAGLKLHMVGGGPGSIGSHLCVYTSSTTPVMPLPGGGVVIGHIFDGAGARIEDARGFQSARATDHTLFRDFWGEYIAIRPLSEAGAFSVTHSPSVSAGLPCVYWCGADSGFVTSQVSLAEELGLYRRRVDWDYLVRFLAHPFLRTEHTALAGIRELLPGQRVTIPAEVPETVSLWLPWDFTSPEARHGNLEEAAEAVRSAVMKSVRSLAALDRTIHMELSGGLDSSIVACCLRGTAADVTCSTLITSDPGSDERLYASAVATTLGAELRTEEVSIEGLEFSFIDPSDPVRPSVGPLQYAIDNVMGAAGDQLLATSTFTGAGGDSVFGYLRTAAPAVDAWRTHGLRAALRTVHDLATLHQCTVWRAADLTVRKRLRRPPALPYRPDTSFLQPEAALLAALDHPWFHGPPNMSVGDRERIFELAGNQVFMDYAPRRVKRFLRMPLLSQPVVEACLRVPSWMWIAGGQNRAVARLAFADLLPATVRSRRSKGTFMSYLGDGYQCQKKEMWKFLRSGHLYDRGIINPAALEAFIRAPLPPRDRSFTRILDLCRTENWVRHQH